METQPIAKPEFPDVVRHQAPSMVMTELGFFIGRYQMETPYGYCQCGCGQKTSIAKRTYSRRLMFKGKPMRFIRGHQPNPSGENHPSWTGGLVKHNRGGILVRKTEHPLSYSNGYMRRSHLIAETALGKHLPSGAVIHHVDGNSANDANYNLVICNNQAYHMLIHRRQRAYNNCGNATFRKCLYCHEYDHVDNLYITPNNSGAYHRKCYNEHRKFYRAKKKKEGK